MFNAHDKIKSPFGSKKTLFSILSGILIILASTVSPKFVLVGF